LATERRPDTPNASKGGGKGEKKREDSARSHGWGLKEGEHHRSLAGASSPAPGLKRGGFERGPSVPAESSEYVYEPRF